MAVGMGDEGPGDAEYARIAHERPVDQLGQLPMIARRQIDPDLAHLLLDDVEVIDQPIRGRGHRPLLADGRDGRVIGRAQGPVIVPKPSLQPVVCRRLRYDVLGGSESLGMQFEALDTEELGPDRLVGSWT